MRESRLSDEQIVAMVREADATSVAEVAKRHGVSEKTLDGWRRRFGAMEVVDVKRLKRLESENQRLKKLVAEGDLEIEIMKECNNINREGIFLIIPGPINPGRS